MDPPSIEMSYITLQVTPAAGTDGVSLREQSCKVGKPHCITEVFS